MQLNLGDAERVIVVGFRHIILFAYTTPFGYFLVAVRILSAGRMPMSR